MTSLSSTASSRRKRCPEDNTVTDDDISHFGVFFGRIIGKRASDNRGPFGQAAFWPMIMRCAHESGRARETVVTYKPCRLSRKRVS
jgi:hypothetical protein